MKYKFNPIFFIIKCLSLALILAISGLVWSGLRDTVEPSVSASVAVAQANDTGIAHQTARAHQAVQSRIYDWAPIAIFVVFGVLLFHRDIRLLIRRVRNQTTPHSKQKGDVKGTPE